MRSPPRKIWLCLFLPLFACADQVVGWPAPDQTAPTVSATTPGSAETGVALNTPVVATFSEAMDPATIDGGTFTVSQGANTVPGAVSYTGVTAIFTPFGFLDADTTYTATVHADATDVAGNALAEAHVWSFTTGELVDDTAPTVTFTAPGASATDVVRNTPVVVTFSEAMSPATLQGGTFTVSQDGTPVAGTVSYTGVTAVFVPSEALEPDTEYTATVSDDATDLAGNALADPHVWSFTTGADVDDTAPTVTFTAPAASATDVVRNTPVVATFSEAMAAATVDGGTFTLSQGGTPVAGTVSYTGVTAIFLPTVVLEPDTEYTATVSDDATDLAGNALADPHVWSFTTGAFVDDVAPVVTFTSPVDGAIGRSLDTHVTATFSEAMAAASLTEATVTLFDGGTAIEGTVSYMDGVVTFVPDALLDAETTYVATVHSDATDLVGNPMLADYVWSFTTGPVGDTTAPRVISTIPLDDATNVPRETNISAVFSEHMDGETIDTTSFIVQQLGTIVAGTVTYSNRTATFDPTSPLLANTTYSVVITTAARDLAGNPLAQSYTWNFRTGATLDATRPRVISTTPVDEASDVPRDAQVIATFNEAMDPQTFDDTTFTLFDGATPVIGTVALVGNNAVFTPGQDLDADTEYTATISGDVTDIAGNALDDDYIWTFTTGDELDPGAPMVILTTPDDLATEVPLNATVSATFDEPMNPLTISGSSFFVTGPDLEEVPGMVSYDALESIATFAPDEELDADATYTATITVEATDLAGNPMDEDYVWTFSTGDEASAMDAVNLRSLSTFVAVAGAGLTNSNSSGVTVLNGDVGLYPTATCQGDGSPCSITNPVINGTLYAADPEGVAAQAKVDLTAAYEDAMSRPVGTTVNDISGMTLAPGVYTSDSTMSIAVGGTVTLDGQGNANAVWIFQIGSSLTVNNNAQLLLINGAKAKNVFWAVFASSTLGSEVSFHGNVLAGASNSVGTDSTVVGRLLCRTGQITLLSNTITLPAL